MDNYKKCPFCAEEINIEAIKCKFCGSSLIEKKKISQEALFIIFFFLPIIIGLGIYLYLYNIYYFESNDCKKIIAEKMKDPDSLEFVSYEGIRDNQELKVKGEYKAKNSFGAYDKGYFLCEKVGEDDMKAWISDTQLNSLDDVVDDGIDKMNDILNQVKELNQ